MSGRQGQGQDRDAWERRSSNSRAAMNGTGKQRAVPQRPPGMTRLETPPSFPRVTRPQREMKPPKSRGRRLLIFVGVLFVIGMVVFVIVYGLSNYIIGVNNSSGAANTATDFLLNLQSQNYTSAYNDLGGELTITMHVDNFTQIAKTDDHCFGTVTDFNEVAGSATTSADSNTQSYAYNITRSKLPKSYRVTLTIQKDSQGNWDIISYGSGNDLGPNPPTCA